MNPTRLLVTALVAGVVTLTVGCAGEEPCPERQATPLDEASLGAIEGIARFEGTPPPAKTIEMAGSGECSAVHEESLTDDSLIVTDGRLANVFVSVTAGLEGLVFDFPTTPVVLDQRGCVYEPRILAARVCQPVRFLNNDKFMHNVHSKPTVNKGFNLVLSTAGQEKTRIFREEEMMIEVVCDVHPWMKSFIGVVDHPFFAVTGTDGSFSLSGLPAGEYELQAWHERLGTMTGTATVIAGGRTDFAIEFAFADPN